MKITSSKVTKQVINNISGVKRIINKVDWLLVILISIVILIVIVCMIAYIESSFRLAFSGLTAVGTIGVVIFSVCMVFRNEKKDLVDKAREGRCKVYSLIRLIDKVIIEYKEDLSLIDIYGYEVVYSNKDKSLEFGERERVYEYIEEVMIFISNNFENKLSINSLGFSETDGLNPGNIRDFRNISQELQTVGLIYTGINEEVIEDAIYNEYRIKEYYIKLLSITRDNLKNTLKELETLCKKAKLYYSCIT